MALLAEYALTPDIFDSASYSSDEVGRIQLQYLKEALLNEAIVRNLRDGKWLSLFASDNRPWHPRGKELLKKLVLQKRLRPCRSALPNVPTTDCEWCQEALASHGILPMAGIVVTGRIANCFRANALVASVDRLSSATWWADRSSSIRLPRILAAYTENLSLVLQCANSLMFIDPHLDPSLQRYQDFIVLVCTMAGRSPAPLIEFHRACYVGSGPSRQIRANTEWQSRFHNAMDAPLRTANLTAEVFIWDDLHDRYLISDLVGISLPNGYDTTANSTSITTWNRLGRNDRDDIQREFDPASRRHQLRYRFRIP